MPPDTTLNLSHALIIGARAVTDLVPYLEAILERPRGDPAGGPMHVDGAYNWFRRANPRMRTLVPPASWVVQRSSRSDIAAGSWLDRIPFSGLLRRLRGRLRRG